MIITILMTTVLCSENLYRIVARARLLSLVSVESIALSCLEPDPHNVAGLLTLWLLLNAEFILVDLLGRIVKWCRILLELGKDPLASWTYVLCQVEIIKWLNECYVSSRIELNLFHCKGQLKSISFSLVAELPQLESNATNCDLSELCVLAWSWVVIALSN